MKFGNSRYAVELTGRHGASYDGKKARYLNSFWLYLEPDDEAFTPHWRDGFWEAWITAWLDAELDNHDIFLDVGANVGYYTFMAAAAGVETWAFEPQRSLVKLLHKSKRVNKADNVTIHDYALSDKWGVVEMSVPLGHSGAGSISGQTTHDARTERVRTVPLDKIIAFPTKRHFLIKIDAEGAEPQIWAGMQRLLSDNIVTVILEWAPSRYEDPRQFATELLGYEVTIVNTDGFEQPVTMDSLLAVQDFEMIVVRN